MELRFKLGLTFLLLGLGILGQVTVHYMFLIPKSNPFPKINAIVRLVRDNKTFCTGTVVSDHVVITAAHCVMQQTPFGAFMNGDNIEIRGPNDMDLGVVASPVYATSQMDQAILYGHFEKFEHKPIITDFKRLTEIGDSRQRFVSCGYPLQGPLVCTREVFQHKEEFFWAVKGSLYPGMSGGPTMLPDGHVVAVNTAVAGDLSIVSPIYNLVSALKKEAK